MRKTMIIAVLLLGLTINACSASDRGNSTSPLQDSTAVTDDGPTSPTGVVIAETAVKENPTFPTSSPTTGYVYNPDTSAPAYCALANRPPATEQELAAMWISVCIPSLTPPLSPAYLDPPAAIRVAMRELGIDPFAANPLVQRIHNSTLAMAKAYHLVTADHGHFNQDTTDYLNWVKHIIRLRSEAEGSAEWDDIRDLSSRQVHTAIYDPDTNIGVQIRLLEQGLHPLLPGEGPEVYWVYLIEPMAAIQGRNLEWERSAFNRMHVGYRDLALTNSPRPPDFGAYLASINYVPPGAP